MTNLGPNADLIGDPQSLENLFTPALIIDLDAFERNVARMASYCHDHKIGFRPHAKTHKSVEIARRQIAAGALGVCTATLGEAEALAEGGIDNILITTPAVGTSKIERFLKLYRASNGLMIVVDNITNARDLGAAAQAAGLNVDVLVALDIGNSRIGATPEQAYDIVVQLDQDSSLSYKGIHAYCGNHQHIQDYQERVRKVEQSNDVVRDLLKKLSPTGITSEIITGVGTGSHEIDANGGLYTEMQIGSYVFMDIQYNVIDWAEDAYEQSLFIATRVVSNSHQGFVITDGGTKRFSMGEGAPQPVDQEHWSYDFKGDEHGKITYGNHNDIPEYGALVKVIPPHCDPTVNLYDHYHVIQDDRLVDIWPIEARGAF